jgi:dTDP-4-dehydrorhamnose 3,5-epimerase
MLFSPAKIPGVFSIRPQPVADDRGYFARTFCLDEMTAHGVDPTVVQRSVSYNRLKGTLRGMHFQAAPHQENKLVSCLRGAIFDVVVDLRRDSPTYRSWVGFDLDGESLTAIFIPQGCAHGFLTLTDDALVHYEISAFYRPDSARGLRYDDPAIGIEWPAAPSVVSARDLAFPPFTD